MPEPIATGNTPRNMRPPPIFAPVTGAVMTAEVDPQYAAKNPTLRARGRVGFPLTKLFHNDHRVTMNETMSVARCMIKEETVWLGM
jgi:hypothetical protein